MVLSVTLIGQFGHCSANQRSGAPSNFAVLVEHEEIDGFLRIMVEELQRSAPWGTNFEDQQKYDVTRRMLSILGNEVEDEYQHKWVVI